MGAAYVIFGKAVPPHHLAMGTIGLVALIVAKPWATKPKLEAKIEATSPEEEKFIAEYLAKHEKH